MDAFSHYDELDTQYRHAFLPKTTGEELSRQEFVRSLRSHLAAKVAPGNKLAYEARARGRFEAEHGHAPETYHEVRRAMADDPYFNFWSALLRNSQEMMWQAIQIPVERQLPALIAAAARAGRGLGTLTLDPKLEIPRYHRLVDIHCMPGGYHTEFAPDDVANGAVYDRAVYLYAMGRMGAFNDDMGNTVIQFVKERFPKLAPKRILDLGCTVGHSTLPYVDAFPEAQVHAIDVAAPVLRYAHARAESLGRAVHFSQQNAEATNFPDGHFDLIVSHILVHETSHKAIRNIMRECHRLLAPGGVVAHAEPRPFKGLSPFDAFMVDWETRNNNEPYWGGSHEIDPVAIAAETGFNPDAAFEALQPSAYDRSGTGAVKVLQTGERSDGGSWYLWGAAK